MNENDLLSRTFGLAGRVAIVTGASSGLGERFARVLHGAGASVVVAARRADRLAALTEELAEERTLAVTCDITQLDDCERLVECAIGRFGGIDILVNNAGIGASFPAEDEPLDHWRRVLDINLTGLFQLTQLVGRRMIEAGGGSIVNLSSILGLVAAHPSKQASYAASKGAVTQLTRELACQWADRGVRVNAIAPGWFPTDMTQDELFGTESGLRYLRRNCPMERGGNADELDAAVLFLAGRGSTYVTGVTIPVDGGWTAR